MAHSQGLWFSFCVTWGGQERDRSSAERGALGDDSGPAQPPPRPLSQHSTRSPLPNGQLAGPTAPRPTATRPRRAHPLIPNNFPPGSPGRPTGERVPGQPVQPPLCYVSCYPVLKASSPAGQGQM